MALGVVWVVLIALGAFVLGTGGGWFAARRARTTSPSATRPLAEPETVDDASHDAAVPDTVDDASHDAAAETSGHHLAVGDPASVRSSEGAPMTEGDTAPAERRDLDERVRYDQIIGIETENASLRAVAARVPGLERRIRELEAAIHERDGAPGAVIDLTGTDPVARRDVDVTSR